MTERVNNIILEALQSGVPPQVIFDNLRQTDDPDIQVYLKRYQQNVDEFNKPQQAEETPPSQAAAAIASGAPSIGPKEAAIIGGTAGLVGVGGKALYDKFTKDKKPIAPDEKVSGPIRSPAQEEIETLKLERERIKTERAKAEHERWLAKNTPNQAEQILGRKIKDPADQRIADALLAQQMKKAGFAQGPSLESTVPVAQPQFTTSGQAPTVTTSLPDLKQEVSNIALATETADNIAANKTQPPAVANQALTTPPSTGAPTGQTISTAPTSDAVEAPIKEAQQVQKATKPAKKAISPADVGLTKQELGMKNHILGMYGGKEDPAAAKAYEIVKDILGYTPAYPPGQGGSLSKEETGKVLGYRKENIAGPKVNLTKGMKDILKKGGPAVATMAATIEFANAKTATEKANAGTNLLSAVIPPGADILEAGAPTLSLEQIQKVKNMNLLGSPYAQTEQAKKFREKEDYVRRVGAGRGIAPPSAYLR